jgi:WD40 repeat protein
VRPLLQPTAITAMVSHPNRPLVALAGDGQIVLLNTQAQVFVGAIDFPEGQITALRYSRNGEMLVAAGGTPGLDGQVVGFDASTGERLFELGDESDSILALDISPDNQLVALGGPSKKVNVYRVDTGALKYTLDKHTDWVLTLRFSPDGLLLASGDRFGGLYVWEAAQGDVFHTLKAHTGPVNAIDWGAASETLLSAGDDGVLRTWNMFHGNMTSATELNIGPILTIDHRSPWTIAGGREGGSLQDVASDPIAFAQEQQIDRAVIANDGNHVVTADYSGQLVFLDLKSRSLIASLTLPVDANRRASLSDRLVETQKKFEAYRAEEAQGVAMSQANSNAESKVNPSLLAAVLATAEQSIHEYQASVVKTNQLASSVSHSLEQTRTAYEQLQQIQAELNQLVLEQRELLRQKQQEYSAIQALIDQLRQGN